MELLRWHLTGPADEILGSALDRDSPKVQDISYRLLTGTLVTGDHLDEVLIQGEVHPHVFFAVGSMRRVGRPKMQASKSSEPKTH